MIFYISFLAMCQIDYDSAFVMETLDEDIPDYIMYNLEQTEISNQGKTMELTAARAENYRILEETRFYNIDFEERDTENILVREGHSDYGSLMDNNDAVLKGSIYIYSSENEAAVEAEELLWTDESKVLESRNEYPVKLIENDGSYILGHGFYADFRKNEITFSGSVSGELVFEETEEEPIVEDNDDQL